MPREKSRYVLDTDPSVVTISGILHKEEEWNGKTVMRPIVYLSNFLSDTEMKFTQGRYVCLSYLRGEIQNVREQQDIQVKGG